ncbi:hypothetical protein B296_00005089 [Ensete ventricosum]|uniref:Uncharacterized protein n=1 Tax=Ensete ventricosum TaxID=4639 RepID=A0A426Z9E9_ENSVE|nr:hypothetical protein B296_00005089 [Ensete ventricosum]
MEHGFTRARTRLARTGLELDASRPCVARGPPEAISLAGTPRCVGKLSAQPPLRLRVRSGIPDRKTTNPTLLHRFQPISSWVVFLMDHSKLASHPLPPAPQQQGFQGIGDDPRRTRLTDVPPPGPRQGAMLTI